ncbi:DegV family protein, partial [Enterococcus faecium]|uniref:DegV family protein n=1 Tax=Enterococcus faecium TaxID=1352 RepID=UPI003CF99C52
PEEIPGTSLPDGESTTEIFEQIKKDGYEKVLAVTISSGLSGTYNVVRLIAEQQEELEAYVLDTKNIGIGGGFSAIQAAKWLEDGVEWNQ